MSKLNAPDTQKIRIFHGYDYFISPGKKIHLVGRRDDGQMSSGCGFFIVNHWKQIDFKDEMPDYPMCKICDEWRNTLYEYFAPIKD
jgi:hypothetical protein